MNIKRDGGMEGGRLVGKEERREGGREGRWGGRGKEESEGRMEERAG